MGHDVNKSRGRMGTRHGLRPNFQHRLIPLAGLVAAVAFFATTGLLAQQPKPKEYQVKATYGS